MTIKMKLAASFAVVLLLLVGIAGFSIYSLSQLNSSIQGLITGALESKQMAMQLNIEQAEQIRAQRNALLVAPEEAGIYYKQAADRNDAIDKIAAAFMTPHVRRTARHRRRSSTTCPRSCARPQTASGRFT